MSSALVRVSQFTKRHPVVRGMLSYAVIWPVSNVCQQTMAGRRWDNYDWAQVLRFSLYGSLFVAPTLYAWVRFSSFLWPRTDFKTAVKKALVEQVTYGPAAMSCFFFGMSLLEFKSVDEAAEEVKDKLLPTYKVGVCVWPILQTINFYLVPERNRVPFVSLCSLAWTSFLAYMKQLDTRDSEGDAAALCSDSNNASNNSSSSNSLPAPQCYKTTSSTVNVAQLATLVLSQLGSA